MNYYIYNPYANNGMINHKLNKFDKKLLISTDDEKQIKSLKRKLKKDDIIYFIGGDGTLCYILNHFSFLSKYEIRYVGIGTANDFNRSLNNENVYYYTINNQYHFINGFGIGFDALVCYKVNNLNKKTKLSYLKQCYLSLKEYEPISLDLYYDNELHHFDKVWLCSLQNGQYFGGGIKIAKDANINEDLIDLVIGHNCNRIKVLLLLIFVKLGLAHYFKKIFFTKKIDQITIKNNAKILTQFDGDTIFIKDDITITNKTLVKIKKYSLEELLEQ
ncbi:MAG: hypothetical protein LBR40_04310 [Bacilli bacterium]|jgi:diacylglycerol kinase family enzyme|nr:hypothetical protein [Bacilli bacterium]